MLKKIALFHLLPIVLSIGLSWLILSSIIGVPEKTKKEVVIRGDQKKNNGRFANLIDGDQAEIDFLSSIKTTNQITLFGSSEFSSSPYTPYYFLPKKLNIPTLGIGHAYHQSLSIMCELLAAEEFLNNSKVCIFLSLGWFETEGTNSSAFIEFARPNFLTKISNSNTIPEEYKLHLGKYIYENQNEFDGITKAMSSLRDNYLIKKGNLLAKLYANLRTRLKVSSTNKNITYKTTLLPQQNIQQKNNDSIININNYVFLKDSFAASVTNNNLFVYNEYYSNYLINKDGTERIGKCQPVPLKENKEFADFLMLTKYLKSQNVNCSFIIQPLNPYYYKELTVFNPIVDAITKELDSKGFPYLNMHVTSVENYEPGILNDIMHLGDYGWAKTNAFLYNVYGKN